MAERKKIEQVEDVIEEVKTPEADPEEFNQHVKNLVALYAREIFDGLEERISDLERLVVENPGAVTFTPIQYPVDRGEHGPVQVAEPYIPPETASGGTAPWYRPD